ncbi:MAG: hypothetical protein JWN95_1947 [Frankiales bacterium]|nr:hypothetical protein [Frankiales bacterium]
MTRPGVPAGQQEVRRHNTSLVLGAIAARPGSRAELAQRTGLTKATVASVVDALLARQVLAEGEPIPGAGRGRPSRLVALAATGPVALGLEINVDYSAAALLDLSGAMIAHRRVIVDNRRHSVPEVLAGLIALAGQLIAGRLGSGQLSSGPARAVLGAGLAVPGVVGPDRELLRVPNLPEFTGLAIGPALDAALTGVAGLAALTAVAGIEQTAASVENEANLGALARLWSNVDGSVAGRNFVYVSGEVGVGAGLVVDGQLFRGVNGFAGELGHVVVDHDGPRCGCGGQGCVEQYAGQEVLLRAARQPDVDALLVAAASRDRATLRALDQAGSALGVGLSSLLNVVDVPMVVLGGLYARLFDLVTPSLTEQLSRRVLASRFAGGQVRRSSLGPDAAVRGAAGQVVAAALRAPDRLLAG